MGGYRHASEHRHRILVGETAVESHPALARGMLGPDVRDLQTRLRLQGFHRGAADGAFGPLTEAAVMRFQRSRGLEPDGFVTSRVWRALGP